MKATNKERREDRKRQRNAPPYDRAFVLTVTLAVIAVILYAVLVPVHAAIYEAPIALTMVLALAAVGPPLISLRYPNLALILFTVSAVLFPLIVSREASVSAPWPWSVPMLIAFVVVVATVTDCSSSARRRCQRC